ncbi:MAG: hypothetical protein GXP41_02980 [Chloroflexi bacterium]|nr:hypothetical protein [Chloroflexota bacterium]
MTGHPLAEVFGFPPDNLSTEAERYRNNTLCPYHNKVPSCTKDKANNPLGVCSIHDGDTLAITCPIRFRQDWSIIEGAARFFFAPQTSWTSLQEIRLNDAQGQSAGNIDFVLVAYDDHGQVIDFGSLEVQAVYISGNVRRPFEHYMADRAGRKNMVWTTTHVRPDYLSSSRKRLVPQMIYKGRILKAWGKRQVVALHEAFYSTLPQLPTVEPAQADIAWLIYGLDLDRTTNCYSLAHRQTIYTLFQPALDTITTPTPSGLNEFIEQLQQKLDKKLDGGFPPDAPSLADVVIG